MEQDVILSSDQVRQLRLELGWTQQVMAHFLRVTTRSVQNWESGSVVPNEFQMAVLVQLRDRLKRAQQRRQETDFVRGLQDLMPKIIFGAGVLILLAYLFQEDS